ncbi:MAG: hypothetical protein WDL87_06615 [Candidatus Omnitrophota bacterium]|jgi:glycosyltransferase involved in cell wall biosynthesis
MDLSGFSIGYVPFRSPSLHPFDLRNFVYYARKRNIPFEIADPNKEYDIVVLTPQVDLSFWNRFPRRKTKLIYMLVDSYLAVSGFDLKGALRGFAKFCVGEHRSLRLNYADAIKDMCRRADAVMCSTLEQKHDIQEYCRNVHVILEFHQKIASRVKNDYAQPEKIKLVWEGRPENAAALAGIKDVLIQLKAKYPLSLYVITDLEYGRYMNRFKKVSMVKQLQRIFGSEYHANTVSGNDSLVYLYQWNKQDVSRLITGCDIAVIPLDTADPLMRGKPENKLLFFWRMGMPCVVSAIPTYTRIMEKIGMPLYCKNNQDWYEKLEKLILGADARKAAGLAGLKIAETEYSQEQYLLQWDRLFESVKK